MIQQYLQGRAYRIVLVIFLLVSAGPVTASPDKEEIAVRDVHFGETLYHFYQGKYFTAISDLLVAKAQYPIKLQGHYPELLLGGLYLSYNMSKPASSIFNRLATQTVDKSIQSSAWYYLARIDYNNGDLGKAQTAVDKVTADLPYRYNDEFQHLRSNILLKQHKYKEAIPVLESFSGSTEWSNYSKFNLAIALIMSDKQAQGMKLLEEVANIKASDVEQVALRDKANLSLGYSALRNKQHDKAAAFFKKIRLTGSQSNKALLGVGWAFYKEGKLKRALVPWVELKNRATKDPVVQEALLTIPHALEGLNAKEQALSYYNEAVNTYNAELSSIDHVIKAIKSGEFTSALRNIHLHQQIENHQHYTSLPDSIATPYLQGLIAEQHFQNILKTYRDLLYMKNILVHWDSQMPAYKLMLNERTKAYRARVPLIKSFYKSAREPRLKAQYDTLNKRFKNISNTHDIYALANANELSLLNKLKDIEAIINKYPNEELEKQREQLRLFKGLIYWQIADNYAARYWQIKKKMIQIKRAFVELDNKKKASVQKLHDMPKHFVDFQRRIKLKQTEIQRLSARIDRRIKKQENLITRLSIDDLKRQRHQIENYHIRASYSLTRLYDSLAALGKSDASR